MSTRFEFKGIVFRLFDSEAGARECGRLFFSQTMTPVAFDCGWLLRNSEGAYYDAQGKLRDSEVAVVTAALSSAAAK